MKLYRAANTTVTAPRACFAERLEDAVAYTDNPGFGGCKVFSAEVAVSEDRVLRVDGFEALAEALVRLGFDAEWDEDYSVGPLVSPENAPAPHSFTERMAISDLADSWKMGQGGNHEYFYQVIEADDLVLEALQSAYDWVVYEDDYPVNCTTWMQLTAGSHTLEAAQ